MLKALCHVFLLLVAIRQLEGLNVNRDMKPPKSQEWDYLVFTQEWPQAACLAYKALNSSHVCNITDGIATWTVHGIWPSTNSGSSPSFCNESRPFDFSQIQDIKPSLNKFWPNLYAHTPEDQLWAHEWDKHGTCAASLPALKDELSFFEQGLTWVKRYNMLGILSEAGINPDAKTPVMVYDIDRAIKKALGVKPMILCDQIKKTTYIYELELCFDKSLNLMDCPARSILIRPVQLGTEECPKTKVVWYPPIEYSTSKLTNHEEFSPSWAEKLLKRIFAISYILM